ncbi:MAG: hypothetical protein JW908_16935 [Anaerolineales bacterium]|nr:hypothetical protein [Anaerolineales bacterium]
MESGALMFSILMLKTRVYNKFTGWVSVLTHGFDLSKEIIGLFLPAIKDFFVMAAGHLYILWFVLIAIRLFQLSKS